MRFERLSGDKLGNWYELLIVAAPGNDDMYFLLAGWGPLNLVLEDKRKICEGTFDSILEEFNKQRTRIEAAGFIRIDEKETT